MHWSIWLWKRVLCLELLWIYDVLGKVWIIVVISLLLYFWTQWAATLENLLFICNAFEFEKALDTVGCRVFPLFPSKGINLYFFIMDIVTLNMPNIPRKVKLLKAIEINFRLSTLCVIADYWCEICHTTSFPRVKYIEVNVYEFSSIVYKREKFNIESYTHLGSHQQKHFLLGKAYERKISFNFKLDLQQISSKGLF